MLNAHDTSGVCSLHVHTHRQQMPEYWRAIACKTCPGTVMLSVAAFGSMLLLCYLHAMSDMGEVALCLRPCGV
jgi:hypothetical protein